jgi:hypothetical protein
MAYFQTKNPNLGKFWRVLEWEGLVYYLAMWNILWVYVILWQFGTFSPVLVYFVKKNLATLTRIPKPIPKLKRSSSLARKQT